MSAIPRDKNLDNTRALLRESYTFISTRCERYQSDIFEARIMLAKAICMRGEEAAREFYALGRFTRKRALPKPTLWLLQDQGAAQVLEGEAHRSRKQMLMSLMSPASIGQEFEWSGRRFERDEWMILDLYGTNHDSRIWQEPQRFQL